LRAQVRSDVLYTVLAVLLKICGEGESLFVLTPRSQLLLKSPAVNVRGTCACLVKDRLVPWTYNVRTVHSLMQRKSHEYHRK